MASSKTMSSLPEGGEGEDKPLLTRQAATAAPSVAASRRVHAAMYTSYFLAAWAWRAMEFTIALVLIDLYPDSLLLVSLYGLLDNGVRITLGSSVGSYIDRSGRWQGARNCYLLQNLCVSSAGLSLAAVLAGWVGTPGHPEDSDKPRYWLLVSCSLLLSSASSLGSTGVKIAVEKRMPKLLCTPPPSASASSDQDASSHELSKMNSIFRAIDLVCLLASPIVSGVMMTFRSPAESLLLLVCYCLVAWVPELTLLKWAITTSPQLNDATPKAAASSSVQRSSTSIHAPLVIAMSTSSSGLSPAGSETPATPSPRRAPPSPPLSPPPPPPSPPPPAPRASTSCIAGWGVYFRQPVLLANLALALLYMTVLSLGFLMTSFLKWAGLTEAEVSLYRGAGAITGLAATAIYPLLRCSLGTVNTGLLGIVLQLTCLCVGVLPVIWATLTAGPSSEVEGLATTPGPEISQVRLLIGSVVASRSGLWLFDLAVTQLVQDRVVAGELGVVCGVQSSVQSCFETASFLAGTFLTTPGQFWMLMSGSLGVVSTATVLYSVFAFSQAGHDGKQYQQVADKEQEQAEEC